MIREVTNWKLGEWVDCHIFRPTERKGIIFYISGRSDFRMTTSEKEIKFKQSKEVPVCIGHDWKSQNKKYWLYVDKLYWENDNLEPQDIKLLLDEKIEKRNRKIEKLKLADTTSDNEVKREPISDEVKMYVWKRDGGKCVNCGSNINLEFDHIIPVSMGGSNTARNIQLLCEECNRRKGGNLV